MNNSPIIQLKDLTKKYGKHVAVDHLNLTVNKGEIFGLLGPNGAGKTTSILMMLGLTDPTEGTASVCGHNATRNPLEVKEKVGYLPDSVGFYDNMTALENLCLIARLNGLPYQEAEDRAKQMMEVVGLADDMHKKAGAYSRGMKQRLGLADVLVKDPEVIILDEPTLGIDPSGVKDFLLLIQSLSKQQGLTVLLSSHHLHHVQQVCDRVGIFVDGKLLVEGDIDSLAKRLFNQEGFVTTVTLSDKLAETALLQQKLTETLEIQQIKFGANSIELTSNADITPAIVRQLVQLDLAIEGVHKKVYGLDEIYQKYFENKANKTIDHEKSIGFFQKSFFKKRKN